jgi:methylenetetrahydrofolate reductase (NADPH)
MNNILDNIKSNNLELSFEFFPPKKQEQMTVFYNTVKELKQYNPSFVSITYGALGSTQDKSLEIIKKIKNDFDLEILAHFTCIGCSNENVEKFICELKQNNINNILALRGDIPEGVKPADILHDFNYAKDLVEYLKTKNTEIEISVAGYPEGHPETEDKKQDLYYLKDKVEAGANFIITQMFFNNNYFYDFCDNAKKIGINVPIIPGIMPVSSYKMIEKITKMCGANVPDEIKDFYSNSNISKQEQDKFAYEYTLKQCKDLIDNNISNIHFYTLNKSDIVKQICDELK